MLFRYLFDCKMCNIYIIWNYLRASKNSHDALLNDGTNLYFTLVMKLNFVCYFQLRMKNDANEKISLP